MKFPNQPKKGTPVLDTIREIINYMRSSRVLSINGVTGKETTNGTTFEIPVGKSGIQSAEKVPFKLTAWKQDETFYWKVSQYRSSIQDGTNGNAIDLSPSGAAWTGTDPIKFDINTEIASTKYIVLKASVDEFLVITDWTLAAVDAADAVEVGDDGGTPPKQDEIRLLIGKVIIDTVPEPDTISATQAVFSPQIIVDDMTNGMLCRVFANHGIQIDNL